MLLLTFRVSDSAKRVVPQPLRQGGNDSYAYRSGTVAWEAVGRTARLVDGWHGSSAVCHQLWEGAVISEGVRAVRTGHSG